MSGICAVWRKDDAASVTRTLAAVNAGLRLTGAERSAYEISQEAGAGVAVQSRFDGQQIFRSGRVMLVCDAELLNERELTVASGFQGPRPSTAELLATLYEHDGDLFVDRLRGSFSVIVWDVAQRRLIAAVDGFGIKRLAWYEDSRVLLVATRADALRSGTGRLKINPLAIANVLNFSSNLGPETIFSGVQRLMPGMFLTASDWRTGIEPQTRTTAYWDMRYGRGTNSSEASLSRELSAVVGESVAAHCAGRSAARLGAFLSGGTDSSTVLGLMTAAQGAPVKAFSIGFEEEGFSELEYAALAARKFGAEHHTYLVNANDCLEALPDIVRSFDEPFGNSSAVPTYFCARLAAAAGVDTLLGGDGGDELFGGNERYATDKIFESYYSVPEWLRTHAIEPLIRLPLPNALTRKARGYIRRASMRGVERMLSFQFLNTHAPADVFNEDFLASLGSYRVGDVPAGHYSAAPARDHLDRLLYVDMKITLADNDLPKVTRMSELAGVQTRFPFLDRSVAEFSGRVPANLKVKGFQKRYLFKRAFRELLPPEIIRKKKHGFGIPVALWTRSDPRMRQLAHDTLLSARAFDRGYFKRTFIEDLFRKHEASDDTYYGDTLWTFLMLELWLRQVVDEPVRAGA